MTPTEGFASGRPHPPVKIPSLCGEPPVASNGRCPHPFLCPMAPAPPHPGAPLRAPFARVAPSCPSPVPLIRPTPIHWAQGGTQPPARSVLHPPFFPFWAPGCPASTTGPPSGPLSSSPPVLRVGAVVPGPPGDHAARRAPPVSPLLSMSVYLRPPHRCRRMIPAAWEGLQEHAQRCAPASPLLTVAPPSHLWVPRFVALPFCNPVAASPAPTAAPPVVWSIVYVCLPLTSQAELIPLRSLPSNPLPSSLLVPLAGSQECTNRFSFLFLFSCFFPPN